MHQENILCINLIFIQPRSGAQGPIQFKKKKLRQKQDFVSLSNCKDLLQIPQRILPIVNISLILYKFLILQLQTIDVDALMLC